MTKRDQSIELAATSTNSVIPRDDPRTPAPQPDARMLLRNEVWIGHRAGLGRLERATTMHIAVRMPIDLAAAAEMEAGHLRIADRPTAVVRH